MARRRSEREIAHGWTPVRVALFGVGQVGTMIGLAARSRRIASEILVADPDPRALAESRARGLVPDEVLDPSTHGCDADVILLAAPVPQIVELVGRIGHGPGPHQLLIDTGSAKGVVVEAMRRLPASVHAVGGHPMAGTETPGAAGARPELLEGAPFAVVPARNDPIAVDRGRAFAEALGARPVVISAEEHDRIVARTSHLPHLVAYALSLVAQGAGTADVVSNLTGTGLRGATRLAASDPHMVAAFLSANRDHVSEAIEELRTVLGGLEEALNGGPGPLTEALSAAAGGAVARR